MQIPQSQYMATLLSYSEAAHRNRETEYGKTGGVSGMYFYNKDFKESVFHAIGCTSTNQKRI